MSLAIDLAADFVVLDDRRARIAASALGVPVVGSLGLLVSSKQRGLIDAVRPLMDAMISHGQFTSEDLYQRILSIAGESES